MSAIIRVVCCHHRLGVINEILLVDAVHTVAHGWRTLVALLSGSVWPALLEVLSLRLLYGCSLLLGYALRS